MLAELIDAMLANVLAINFGDTLATIPDGTPTTFLAHEVRVGVTATDRRGGGRWACRGRATWSGSPR